jgi:hypothetical protein
MPYIIVKSAMKGLEHSSNSEYLHPSIKHYSNFIVCIRKEIFSC